MDSLAKNIEVIFTSPLNASLLDEALKDTLAKINSFVDEYDFNEALKRIDAWEAVD